MLITIIKPVKKIYLLVYKGQLREFVQETAFGDIPVSLPATESKELFGLKQIRVINL
jgi:hypothetical protein